MHLMGYIADETPITWLDIEIDRKCLDKTYSTIVHLLFILVDRIYSA